MNLANSIRRGNEAPIKGNGFAAADGNDRFHVHGCANDPGKLLTAIGSIAEYATAVLDDVLLIFRAMVFPVAVDAVLPMVQIIRCVSAARCYVMVALRRVMRTVGYATITGIAPMCKPALDVAHTKTVRTSEIRGLLLTASLADVLVLLLTELAEFIFFKAITAAAAGMLVHTGSIPDAVAVLALSLLTADKAHMAEIADGRTGCTKTVVAARAPDMLGKALFIYAHTANAALCFAGAHTTLGAKSAIYAEIRFVGTKAEITSGAVYVCIKVFLLHAHTADTARILAVDCTALGAKSAGFAEHRALCAKIEIALGAVHVRVKAICLYAHTAYTARILTVGKTALEAKLAIFAKRLARLTEVKLTFGAVCMNIKDGILHARTANAALVCTIGKTAIGAKSAIFAKHVAHRTKIDITFGAERVLIKIRTLSARTARTSRIYTIGKTAIGAKSAIIAKLAVLRAEIVAAILRTKQMLPEFEFLYAHAAFATLVLTIGKTAIGAKSAELARLLAIRAEIEAAILRAEQVLPEFGFIHAHTAFTALVFGIRKTALRAETAKITKFKSFCTAVGGAIGALNVLLEFGVLHAHTANAALTCAFRFTTVHA